MAVARAGANQQREDTGVPAGPDQQREDTGVLDCTD